MAECDSDTGHVSIKIVETRERNKIVWVAPCLADEHSDSRSQVVTATPAYNVSLSSTEHHLVNSSYDNSDARDILSVFTDEFKKFRTTSSSLDAEIPSNFDYPDHDDIDIQDSSSSEASEEQKALFENQGYPLIGDIPVLNRKIFRGMRVSIVEHPYVVSIRRRHSHYLTGAIITRRIIITVAHPLYNVPTHELGVVTGENYSDRGTLVRIVLFVVIHDNFDPYTLDADLALLYIGDKMVNKPNQKPIPLIEKDALLELQPEDDNPLVAFVTGWGRCDFTGNEICLPRSSEYFRDEIVDPMLRTVTMKFVPPHENFFCIGYQKHEIKIGKGMLCAGTAREEQVLAGCMAVPGAPLVLRGKLLGLLSWGFGCGYTHDLPLIYTDLQDYNDWILHNINITNQAKSYEFEELYIATKTYIILDWLTRTRELKPEDSDSTVDHLIRITEADKLLLHLKGEVTDFRDYIHNGQYRQIKADMYKTVRIQLIKQRKYEEIRQHLSLRESRPFMNEAILKLVDMQVGNNSDNDNK